MLKLHTGDTIGIASPSHLAEKETYEKIFAKIREMGLNVKPAQNLYARGWGYSATDRERADDLNALIRDPEVKMIFFGGGEGADEVIPLIDYDSAKANPKIWLTYSDGTSILNAVHSRTGQTVLYGQAPKRLLEDTPYNREMFNAFVFGGGMKKHAPATKWRTIRPGKARGELTGGYLDNYVYLALSGWIQPEAGKEYVLFLEDHEKFFGVEHVSDLLGRLSSAPIMKQVRGVLFGNYSDEDKPYLDQQLARLGEKWNIPVAACNDYGHGKYAAILPIGETAELDAANGTLEYPNI